MPKAGSIEVIPVGGAVSFHFTDLGLAELKRLMVLGTPVSDLAEFFQVSEDWMRRQMTAVEAVRSAAQEGAAQGKEELRKALHESAINGDARVLTFLGERRLKMNKVVEHQHEHTMRVIGSQPKDKLESGDWFKRFAPGSVQDAEIIEGESNGHGDASETDSAERVRKELKGPPKPGSGNRPDHGGADE